METEGVVAAETSAATMEQSDADFMAALGIGVQDTDTPESKQADLSPTKTDAATASPEGDATPAKTDDGQADDGEHVQVSKADWMRLMNMEAKQRLAEANDAKANTPQTNDAPAEAAKVQETPVAKQDWTPEFKPVPIDLPPEFVEGFGFSSKEEGDNLMGRLYNGILQNAVAYTQNAIASMEARMNKEIQTRQEFSYIAPAVMEVFNKKQEYLDYPEIVHEAANRAVRENPSIHITKLPGKIIELLDAGEKKATQIMKSGGKINAVPKSGLKAGETGARSPRESIQPTEDSPDVAYAKLLGLQGY